MRCLMLLLGVSMGACTGPDDDTPKPPTSTTPPPAPTPPPDPEPTTPPTDDCSATDFDGTTYDCTVLDRCVEEDQAYLDACCDCDAELCGADPTCIVPLERCMDCHNGSVDNDYAGPGLVDPHPFTPDPILCTTCHGGDAAAEDAALAHVPPPPQIGDTTNQLLDPQAYFNRLTLTGIDKYPDYTDDAGTVWTALDYLQFINPSDLRVVNATRSCGDAGCHGDHAQWVTVSPLGSDRIVSTALSSMGLDHANVGWYQNTSASVAWRELEDPNAANLPVGTVGLLTEIPTGDAVFGTGPMFQNASYTAAALPAGLGANNQLLPGTRLETVVRETLVGACADCHAMSAGPNHRAGEFRGSGCASCHMTYALDGRSLSTDPNLDLNEPIDADAIRTPERSHPIDHRIRSVATFDAKGVLDEPGISDLACAGCHAGTNATVLQYWGLRVDANRAVTTGNQYPANPATFANAGGDTRLFGNNNTTFTGLGPSQILSFEDYDGDGRDDTPADVHAEAGLGCIDCHGSADVHGGTSTTPTSPILSHQSQIVGIRCASCHGDDAGLLTTSCTDYDGNAATCTTDRNGSAVRNVTVDAQGYVWLRSRVDGLLHSVPQVLDLIRDDGTLDPITGQPVYSPEASYAMGRADGNVSTGIGPMQVNPALIPPNFSHLDNLSCESCHASWTSNCIGCHLTGIYDENPNNEFFNNVDGERVVNTFTTDTIYSSPILFGLGVTPDNEIGTSQIGASVFFRYLDLNNDLSDTFAFSDLNGNGNQPNAAGRGPMPALQHARVAPHSIRGAVTASQEGVGGCVRCHLNNQMINDFTPGYETFVDDMQNRNYAALDYVLLEEHIGKNPGNQLNSPYYVHMTAGRGSGLFQFDAQGCPNNPLDTNPNVPNCVAPASVFDPNNTAFDLDQIVESTGTSNASNPKPNLDQQFSIHRSGALYQNLAGPLGRSASELLADPNFGVILDSWFDADGNAQGDAGVFVP